MTGDSLTALAMVAASAVVIAALQNIVSARMRWVAPIALAFGVLNGFAFGESFAASAPLAGSHQWVALTVFLLVVDLGQFWLGAVVWATRLWLAGHGTPERVVSVLASVVIAHEALHRVVDRGHLLAQSGSFGAERAIVCVDPGLGVRDATGRPRGSSPRTRHRPARQDAAGPGRADVMATRIIESPAGSTRNSGRERAGVFALAGVIITVVVVYLALNATSSGVDSGRGLLPYQSLASTLPEPDQQQFRALREALLTAEAGRARDSRWPEAASLGLPGADYQWARYQRGVVTNYLGQPRDPSQPAWLLEIQEPEPGMLPDPAPNDERTPSPAGRNHPSRLCVDASFRRTGDGRLRTATSEQRLDRSVLDRAQSRLCHQEMIDESRQSLDRGARIDGRPRDERRRLRATETGAEDRRHPPSVLLVDQEHRRQPAGIRGAIDPAGRDRRRRLSAAPRRHQETRRPRRNRGQRDRPRRFHHADAPGLRQQEDRHHPAQRDDSPDSCRRVGAA